MSGYIKERNDHFTDRKTIMEDEKAGDIVAGIIGDTYIDSYFQSPVEQWTQIVKALRRHGIRIEVNEKT